MRVTSVVLHAAHEMRYWGSMLAVVHETLKGCVLLQREGGGARAVARAAASAAARQKGCGRPRCC